MIRKILRYIVIIISVLILIILYYYGNVYRTDFSEFTNVDTDNISRLDIEIFYHDKAEEEFKIDNKEKIKQIINILNEYELRRNIVKEKLRALGFKPSYTYTSYKKNKPNRRACIDIHMENNRIYLTLSLNKYMLIWSDKKNPYEFEIANKEYEINNIRDICVNKD